MPPPEKMAGLLPVIRALQPGSFDDGRYPEDMIGRLERFVPLYRAGNAPTAVCPLLGKHGQSPAFPIFPGIQFGFNAMMVGRTRSMPLWSPTVDRGRSSGAGPGYRNYQRCRQRYPGAGGKIQRANQRIPEDGSLLPMLPYRSGYSAGIGPFTGPSHADSYFSTGDSGSGG